MTERFGKGTILEPQNPFPIEDKIFPLFREKPHPYSNELTYAIWHCEGDMKIANFTIDEEGNFEGNWIASPRFIEWAGEERKFFVNIIKSTQKPIYDLRTFINPRDLGIITGFQGQEDLNSHIFIPSNTIEELTPSSIIPNLAKFISITDGTISQRRTTEVLRIIFSDRSILTQQGIRHFQQ